MRPVMWSTKKVISVSDLTFPMRLHAQHYNVRGSYFSQDRVGAMSNDGNGKLARILQEIL